MTKKYNRQRSTKTVSIERYTINGIPTCGGMYDPNHEDGYMVCQFLLTRRFGTQDVCGFGEQVDLYEYSDLHMTKPHDKCPLWSDTP